MKIGDLIALGTRGSYSNLGIVLDIGARYIATVITSGGKTVYIGPNRVSMANKGWAFLPHPPASVIRGVMVSAETQLLMERSRLNLTMFTNLSEFAISVDKEYLKMRPVLPRIYAKMQKNGLLKTDTKTIAAELYEGKGKMILMQCWIRQK